MELTRRGLAPDGCRELFGPGAVPTDKYMRTLGLYRAAEGAIQHPVAGRARRARRLCRGRECLARAAQRRLAARILSDPRPARTLAAGRFTGLGQADGVAARRQFPRRVAPRAHSSPYQARRAEHAVSRPIPRTRRSFTGETDAWLKRPRSRRDLRGIAEFVGPTYESNNWVVDGKHTASGKPMLANDPHLSLNAPGVWYLAHIEDAGARCRRRHRAGQSVCRAGPQRAYRLGLHHHHRRCRGSVHRKNRSRRIRRII